jgi:hypothetical protein
MLCTLVAAAEQASKPLPTPPDLAPKIKLSAEFGHDIYLQDKAAALGTDVLIQHVGSLKGAGVGGYLAVRDAEETGLPRPSWTLIFYTRGDTPAIKYRIHVPMERGEHPRLEAVEPPAPASPRITALIRARQSAIEAAGPFSQPINPVVLPAGGFGQGDDVLVELLAGTERPGVVVLGRHFRVVVSGDGKQVKSVTPLSNSAMELETRDEKGNRVVALGASQLVTDYPVETHVFASLLSGLPIWVMTSRGPWLVNRDSIELYPSPH